MIYRHHIPVFLFLQLAFDASYTKRIIHVKGLEKTVKLKYIVLRLFQVSYVFGMMMIRNAFVTRIAKRSSIILPLQIKDSDIVSA